MQNKKPREIPRLLIQSAVEAGAFQIGQDARAP
jgi:hypothetical protein